MDYQWLYDTVRARFDSDAAMEAVMPLVLSDQALRDKGDDRYLSAMTQRVFQAGMQHTMVNAKWPAFETAFGGFDPQAMARLDDAGIEHHMKDAGIIRHRGKLRTIARNARFILDIRAERETSFGAFIADWPVSDIIGLWRLLARRAAHLGGRSGAGFLRLAGKDSFLLTSDVVARLIAWNVITREPTTQTELRVVQQAFNTLQQDSGRPLCQLSAMMAFSINPVS